MRSFFRSPAALTASLMPFFAAAPAVAQLHVTLNVNCTRGESLASAVAYAFPNTVFNVKGTCAGPVVVTASGVHINGSGAAGMNGGGKDALTVNGAQGVVVSGLAIAGGANGVVVSNGAQLTLLNDTVSGNAQSGIVDEASSSLTVNGGSSKSNGLFGVDVEATSSLIVSGAYSISGNGVFGVNVNNGSSLTLTGATLTVSSNTLGIQMGTNASGFINGQSSLDTSGNFSDGLTIVSGSHMVDFGGTINSNKNFLHGISLNSKGALDLDAGSQVNSTGNQGDGVHMEQSSVMTIFNNPQFSQVQVATLLHSFGNGLNGLNLLTGSRILVDNDAKIFSLSNQGSGAYLDDGSALTFGHSIALLPNVVSVIQGNGYPDVGLAFGSHFTAVDNVNLGSLTCDASSLVRGPNTPTCPH